MKPATSFEDLRAMAQARKSSRLCVAGGDDPEVMKAVTITLREGLVSHVIVTGQAARICRTLPKDVVPFVEFIDAVDTATCATLAVEAVRKGDADILMKGHVDSKSYLRSIVNRQSGLRTGSVLSNVTIAEMQSYHKLIGATDNGIIPAPTLAQKRAIIMNANQLFRGFGLKTTKVAALAATEKVSNGIPATTDAASLAAGGKDGAYPGLIVEGPFGYDVAVSSAAAQTKGLGGSQVAGDVDLLLFHSIEAANAVAKAWKFHGSAQTASIVLGAQVPVLMNSRSDKAASRVNAILLALAVSEPVAGA